MRTGYKVYPQGKFRNRNTRRLDFTTVIQGFCQRGFKIAKPIGKGGKDTPDWGVSSLYRSNVAISDMSELAVRLGSPVTFDRTGNVLFYDAFESGLTNWEHNSFPVGANAVPTARYHSIKPYAIKLHTTTDNNSYSGIRRGLPFPYLSRMGFEFHYKQIANINRLMVNLYFYTGTWLYLIDMELKQETNQILLANAAGIDQVISTYGLSQVTYAPFHIFKIVFDLSTEMHSRLVIDDVEYDVSSISVRKIASAEKAHMYVMFYMYSWGTNARTCYLDNIILTIDEPQ